MSSPLEFYTRQSEIFSHAVAKLSRQSRQLSWSRLITFLALLISIYFSLTATSPAFWLFLTGLFFVLMGVLIWRNNKVNRRKQFQERLLERCSMEIHALNFLYLDFPDGSGYQDHSHPYSSDLDLFGHGSLYQYLNRTVTTLGETVLVQWLREPTINSDEITSRQEACRELSKMSLWRLEFAAGGITSNPGKLKLWLETAPIFTRRHAWNAGILASRIAVVVLAGLVIAGLVSYQFLVLLGLLNLFLISLFLKKINRVAGLLEKASLLMESYDWLFRKLREPRFTSEWILSRMKRLTDEKTGALAETGKLGKLLHRFDSRNNILIGFFRNALFLTDLQLVLQMEQWREKNASHLDSWLAVLGDLDAMNSLAAFAHNNPGYTYPEPVSAPFVLESQDLGHPLIPPQERVNNAFSIGDWHTLVVLTGANMAGKSTFLRTVGLNLVLAHTGTPVCASEYRFLPIKLMTSIRTNDSLIKHESYFYAELKKLQLIIHSLEKGDEVFILLDEVLKGTNSNDKLKGSIILARKLIKLKTSGIIATHDISLGELENEFPSNIRNQSFEADIRNGQLTFDYKLRDGAAKNMTALFLMEQMNIV